MMELLLLYKWTLLAALLTGPMLAFIGAQLAARDQAMQALVLSQASALGVVLGLAILFSMGHATGEAHEGIDLLPTLSAIGFGTLAFALLEKVVSKTAPSRNSYYVTAFASFLALTFLVTSITPQLESHMASVYFGDLAVASESESKLAALVSALVLLGLARCWRVFTDNSFNLAMFGQVATSRRRSEFLFLMMALIAIGLSIQLMGLLFTLSCLFIPTALLARARADLKRHTLEIAAASLLACTAGFLVSLRYSVLPTVPCIVVGLLLVGILMRTPAALRAWLASRTRSDRF